MATTMPRREPPPTPPVGYPAGIPRQTSAGANRAADGAQPSEGNDPDRATQTRLLFERVAASTRELDRCRLRQEIALLNMCVARSIAHRYARRGITLEDLEQVAYLGLLKAVERFDPELEHDFLSYAVPTITGEVKRYFRDCGWMVRPPRRIQELQGRISARSSELAQELGRSPRPREVAAALGVGEDEVIEALASDGAFAPNSLDRTIDGPPGEAGTLGDLLPAEENAAECAEARMLLAPQLEKLADRDRLILERRFLRGWTQQQIADEIGVTQMQVSRLLSRILSDLRTAIGNLE